MINGFVIERIRAAEEILPFLVAEAIGGIGFGIPAFAKCRRGTSAETSLNPSIGLKL